MKAKTAGTASAFWASASGPSPSPSSANHFSETARAAIEAAGGTCEVVRGRPSYGAQTEITIEVESE